jgi:hypothetical protein
LPLVDRLVCKALQGKRETMKKKVINLYTIEEVKGEALKTAISQASMEVMDNNFEAFDDIVKDTLKNIYGLDAKAFYSLSYCQGDGLCFETKDFVTEAIIELLPFDKAMKETIKTLSQSYDLTVSTTNTNPSNYTYAHERHILVEFSSSVEESFPSYTMEAITNAFVDVYLSICKGLEVEGYECLEVQDDEALDYAKENNLLFTKDGAIYVD